MMPFPALDKIFTSRIKYINENSFFEANASMFNVRRDKIPITRLKYFFLPSYGQFKLPAFNVGCLGMKMLMEGSNRSLFEPDLYKHQVVVVTENLSFNARTYILPFHLVI